MWALGLLSEQVEMHKGPGHSQQGTSVLHGCDLLVSPLHLDPASPTCCSVPPLIGHFASLDKSPLVSLPRVDEQLSWVSSSYWYLSQVGLAVATIYGEAWEWTGRSREEPTDVWHLEAWILCGAREQERGGFKSVGLSALLDMASERLVGWPPETSETEKTACWTVPK